MQRQKAYGKFEYEYKLLELVEDMIYKYESNDLVSIKIRDSFFEVGTDKPSKIGTYELIAENLIYKVIGHRSNDKFYVEDFIKVSKDESEILFKEDIASETGWRFISEMELLLRKAEAI